MTQKTYEFDGETGQEIVRDFTADEIAQRELDLAETQQREAEAQAKITARASALAKLAALGLTQDEIDAL